MVVDGAEGDAAHVGAGAAQRNQATLFAVVGTGQVGATAHVEAHEVHRLEPEVCGEVDQKDTQTMPKGSYDGPLEKLDECVWRIPKGYKPGMRVEGRIFADDRLMEQIRAKLAHYGSLIRVPYGEPYRVDEAMEVDEISSLGVATY